MVRPKVGGGLGKMVGAKRLTLALQRTELGPAWSISSWDYRDCPDLNCLSETAGGGTPWKM